MRLITNEELNCVVGAGIAGGSVTANDYNWYDPEDYDADMQRWSDIFGGQGFELTSFGASGGYETGVAVGVATPEKPSITAIGEAAAELRKAFPTASIVCDAKVSNSGPGGSILWSIECTITIKK